MSNRLISSIASAMLALGSLWSTSVLAEAENDYLVDSVYNLSLVRDVTLDGENNTLLITMPNKVLRYSTFPLEVIAEIDIEIDGITSVITKDDDLVILGDGSRSGLSGGSILVFQNIGRAADGPITSLDPFALDITPFAQAVLTDDGDFYGVNPIWYSVIQMSVQQLIDFIQDTSDAPFRPSDLFLKCGTASKLSIFDEGDKTYYITSVIDAKLIEYGPIVLDQQKLPESDCFDPEQPTRSLKVVRQETQGLSLLHEVIDNPWLSYGEYEGMEYQASKRLLTFDNEAGLLSVFPIRLFRGKLAMLRSERYDYDLSTLFAERGLPEGAFGLMSASEDGETILVSYVGSNDVYRLKQGLNELILVGRTKFDKPVQFVSVSKDGNLASVVIGETEKDEQMVLIKNPRNITGDGPLKRERFTVLNVQETLVKEGYEIKVDGIYGEETRQALDEFELNANGVSIGSVAPAGLLSVEPGELSAEDLQSSFNQQKTRGLVIVPSGNSNTASTRSYGILNVPRPDAQSQQLGTGNIGNKVKGLFPLNNR